MYPNINVADSSNNIKQWITEEAPSEIDCPPDFILQSLELCMKENIFYFGDLLFRQIEGTAIGTKCAVVLVNLYVGLLERKHILIKYKNQLHFFKRFIDDIIGVWRYNNHITIQEFLTEMNTLTSLT